MAPGVDRLSKAVSVDNPAFSPDVGQSEAALDRLRQRHLGGDRLALDECVVHCDDHDLPLPRWALAALAEPRRRYLAGTAPVDVFVSHRRGRHGDPRIERNDRERLELSVACSRAAVCAGLRGRERIVAAGQVYDFLIDPSGMSVGLDTETMQDHYGDWNRKGFTYVPLTDPHALLVTCSGQLHDLRSRLPHFADYTTVSGALARRS